MKTLFKINIIILLITLANGFFQMTAKSALYFLIVLITQFLIYVVIIFREIKKPFPDDNY